VQALLLRLEVFASILPPIMDVALFLDKLDLQPLQDTLLTLLLSNVFIIQELYNYARSRINTRRTRSSYSATK
jgi:hypothetical protein